MTTFVFANNVNTQLAAAITNTDTSLTLQSAANLPTLSAGQIMPLTLNDTATGLIYEVVYVTAIAGATLTVTRGQEGTSALAWPLGSYAFSTITAQTAAPINGNPVNKFQVAASTAESEAPATSQINQNVATYAALRLLAVTSGKEVYVQGVSSLGDGGEGIFKGVTGASAGTYVDNGGTIIVPTGGDGSVAWIRVYKGSLNPLWFGGTASDISASVLSAFNAGGIACSIEIPAGTWNWTSAITLDCASSYGFSLISHGVITAASGLGSALTIKNAINPEIYVSAYNGGGVTATDSFLEIENLRNFKIGISGDGYAGTLFKVSGSNLAVGGATRNYEGYVEYVHAISCYRPIYHGTSASGDYADAFGKYGTIWYDNCTVAPLFQQAHDVTIDHIENASYGMAADSLEFTNCAAVNVDNMLLGGTNTGNLVTLTNPVEFKIMNLYLVDHATYDGLVATSGGDLYIGNADCRNIGGNAISVTSDIGFKVGSYSHTGNGNDLVYGGSVIPSVGNYTSYSGNYYPSDSSYAGDTSATANAITIAPITPVPPSGYYDGYQVSFKVANTNTGATTLSVSGLTATPLVNINGVACQGGECVAGRIYSAVYNSGAFVLQNNSFPDFDGLRVNVAPTASTTASDHSIPITIGSTVYYVRLSSTP